MCTFSSDFDWTFVENNIKVSVDAWNSYYSRLLFTNIELAKYLINIHMQFKILKFIFSLDRRARNVDIINKLLFHLNKRIAGKNDGK